MVSMWADTRVFSCDIPSESDWNRSPFCFIPPPSYPSQAVLIKKCSSRSAHLKEVFIKKCSSRGVHQELFIKKCPSRSVHQEVIIKNCSSRSAHQEVFIRKCSSRSVHQEVFIKRSGHQEVLFSFSPLEPKHFFFEFWSEIWRRGAFGGETDRV